MNNWRLLLLAVVAVFQPIASFTDRNLIDGRQQCCDGLSSAPHQDTRSSLHGTYRLAKTTPALRRLNDHDETREDRRNELRQRDSVFSRPSTEKPLVDIRGRVARQGPSEISRSSRVKHPAEFQSRGRLLDVHQREETARSIRFQKHQDHNRRIVDRTSRDALERRNDRVYTESPRDGLFRDDYRTERFGNERLSKNSFDPQREMSREQMKSVGRRIVLNRNGPRVLSRTQDDVRIEASNNMNNRQRIAKERLSAVRRESSIRPEAKRYSEHNDERRALQRNIENRQSLSANTRLVDQIRDIMLIRNNDRKDTRAIRLRMRTNQRLFTVFDERREQRDARRESRQQNKENIDGSASGERRMQVARRITQDSRILIVMNAQNQRNVDGRRKIRQERMSRDIQDKIQENPDQRLSGDRILIERRNIRESSRVANAQNTRDSAGRREIRHNERMSRETRDENRANLEQRLSRERIQMERRNIRDSAVITAQNTRDSADRREIRHNERMTRETRDENRANLEQRLSRERIQMERRNIRDSRVVNAQNTRDSADRRDIRHNERMTREARDENRENLEHRLSPERIQMERRNIHDSRVVYAQNTRDSADRREIRHNERMTREARDENRENLKQRLSPERIQMERRYIRDSRAVNAQNTRDSADRREIRHNERMTREVRDENRENLERLSRERIQMDRRNIRDSRAVNAQNTRDSADRREIRHNERMTREVRDENRENLERLSRERIQMDRRNIRDSRAVNAQNTRDSADRREIRHNERMTREVRDENRENLERLSRERIQMDRRNIRESREKIAENTRNSADRREIRHNERLARETRDENRANLEQRLSLERIQMDRRNIREFRSMNIVIRTDRDVESRREIRTDARFLTDNRENTDHRLSRESTRMERRNTRESRIGNTLHVRDLNSRQKIREARETREEIRENPDRRLARKSRQVNRNIRESRINRAATRNEKSMETDTVSRREIRFNERLPGSLLRDQITRERRLEARSADRVNAERDSSMTNQRTRSVDRLIREISAEPRLSRSTDSDRRSEVFRSRVEHNHREREALDARSRNRERSPVMVSKMEPENDFTVANWQYVLYTLQAAYLCALFMQMLKPSRTGKAQKMSLRWLPVSSHYNPIKVD